MSNSSMVWDRHIKPSLHTRIAETSGMSSAGGGMFPAAIALHSAPQWVRTAQTRKVGKMRILARSRSTSRIKASAVMAVEWDCLDGIRQFATFPSEVTLLPAFGRDSLIVCIDRIGIPHKDRKK